MECLRPPLLTDVLEKYNYGETVSRPAELVDKLILLNASQPTSLPRPDKVSNWNISAVIIYLSPPLIYFRTTSFISARDTTR